jgi:hypothetical protein
MPGALPTSLHTQLSIALPGTASEEDCAISSLRADHPPVNGREGPGTASATDSPVSYRAVPAARHSGVGRSPACMRPTGRSPNVYLDTAGMRCRGREARGRGTRSAHRPMAARHRRLPAPNQPGNGHGSSLGAPPTEAGLGLGSERVEVLTYWPILMRKHRRLQFICATRVRAPCAVVAPPVDSLDEGVGISPDLGLSGLFLGLADAFK